MDHDQIPSSVAFDTTTIPTFRIVEPTPEKGKDRGQELTLTDSTLPLHRILSSHRVLYRGSLSFPTSESDIPLEGICFIAHFDPTSPTKSALMTSSLPLALESQRGRATLNVISVVPLNSLDQRLDDVVDVKMYIHPQSIIARAYFERIFCTDNIVRADGRSSLGVRIRLDDLGDETDDILVYGQLDTSFKGSSTAAEQTIVHIRTARILPPLVKSRTLKPKPRPDDPLPRAHVFTLSDEHHVKRRKTSLSPNLDYPADRVNNVGDEVQSRTLTRSASASSHLARLTRSSVPKYARTANELPKWTEKASTVVSGERSKYDRLSVSEDDVFTAPMAGALASVSSLGSAYGKSRGLFATGISNATAVSTEEDSLLRSNRDSIKKMVISVLASRGIGKDHPDFKEIYQMAARGVTFALRRVLGIRRVEREEVKPLVHKHLDMYVTHAVIH